MAKTSFINLYRGKILIDLNDDQITFYEMSSPENIIINVIRNISVTNNVHYN